MSKSKKRKQIKRTAPKRKAPVSKSQKKRVAIQKGAKPTKVEKKQAKTAVQREMAQIKAGIAKANAQKGKGKYKVEVETGGKVYKTQTDALENAIISFGIKNTNTKTIVRVSCGKNEFEKHYKVADARRLFHNNISGIIFAKNIRLIFEGQEIEDRLANKKKATKPAKGKKTKKAKSKK